MTLYGVPEMNGLSHWWLFRACASTHLSVSWPRLVWDKSQISQRLLNWRRVSFNGTISVWGERDSASLEVVHVVCCGQSGCGLVSKLTYGGEKLHDAVKIKGSGQRKGERRSFFTWSHKGNLVCNDPMITSASASKKGQHLCTAEVDKFQSGFLHLSWHLAILSCWLHIVGLTEPYSHM